ncbi:MAG: phage tail family protein [Clostridia bacterium]
MQRLTYQNGRGEEVVFGAQPPYLLCRIDGLGLADREMTARSGAYQQGESIYAVRRSARTVTLTTHLWAPSRTELYRLRMELCGVLTADWAHANGATCARLTYENDYGAWWTYAVPESGLEWGGRIQNIHPQVKLRFACESPYWYSTKGCSAVFEGGGAGFALPQRLPFQLGKKAFRMEVNNGGSCAAPVLITMEGRGEAAALLNETTGARLKLIAALPVGDVLRVATDPARLEATVKRANGAEENAFGLLDPETSVAGFTLRPGVNTLRYVPDGDASSTVIRVEWNDGYEGV